MAKTVTDAPKNGAEKKKRENLSQADLPTFSLEEALKVGRALLDSYAGGPEAPHNVAIACDLSPTGSQWRMLAGAALAYGLTSGSFSADSISLTPLGKKILSPLSETDEVEGLKESALKPRIVREFYNKYDKNKFPVDKIAINVICDLGISREKSEFYLEIIKKNGETAGFITQTRTGPFVSINNRFGKLAQVKPLESIDEDNDFEDVSDVEKPLNFQVEREPASPIVQTNPWEQPISKVFVSHGKNEKILDQVKEIVAFGKFEPVISKDRETVSKPVPDKVMDDMRACQAAVIHVASERVLADEDGKLSPQINGNVLIEIGAAMALYKRKFILLVESGLELPSNLQGLYEVRYSGDALDGGATMKLLKAFNDFS
jgi:predicted nucleotide-binding protein